MSTRTKTLTWVIALAVGLIGAYWYWSPHLALYEMAKAARNKDADTFNDYVDYPKLRESIKGQFSARLAKELGNTPADSSNPFAAAGSALGAMLGIAMANTMVDAMVRPETVMYAMSHDGRLDPKAAAETSSTPGSGTSTQKPRWALERKGANKVLVYPAEQDVNKAKAAKAPSLVFERTGFATWKLSELRVNSD